MNIGFKLPWQPSRAALIDKMCEQAVELALLKQPRRQVRKDSGVYQARKAETTQKLMRLQGKA